LPTNELLISVRYAPKAVVLDLTGRLVLGETEKNFRDQIQSLLDAGQREIAVNLAGVNFVDSSGIGSMVRSVATISKSGGKCAFFSPQKLVRQTLKMLRLDNVLNLCDDEAAALASL
jgi:anti-sigma B factor antagonist